MGRIEHIIFTDVIPNVFAGDELSSDVWGRDVKFERGALYSIDAASGTGKTTMCSFVYGVRSDYSGTIRFDSDDIRQLRMKAWCEIRRRHIAYLPQELEVFGELSAMDNVLLKNRLTDFRTEGEIRRMFEELGIDNRIDSLCGRMSVGQRQRVALIRALCQPFDFIILDEPVSHLDERNNAQCAAMVAREAAGQEAAVISTSVGNPLLLEGDVERLRL